MSIFSKIIQNTEAEMYRILDIDDNFLVMLSLHPVTKGHTLVIPIDAVDNIGTFKNKDLLFSKTVEWADKITGKLNAEAYTLKINNKLYLLEKDKGHVGHLHFHIIPRYSIEDDLENPKGSGKTELSEIKSQILG